VLRLSGPLQPFFDKTWRPERLGPTAVEAGRPSRRADNLVGLSRFYFERPISTFGHETDMPTVWRDVRFQGGKAEVP